MTPAITVSHLKKNYDTHCAIADLSFTIAEGCIFGMVGADGAGKTTLMRILTTLLQPDVGECTVLGKSIKNNISYIRSHIGYMPQQFSLYGDLSIEENIYFFADVFGVTGSARKERIERLLAFSRLKPFKKRQAAKLSGGMKQKLALCCALIHTPELLILDEPTTGVDPVSRSEFWDILRMLRSEGITIFVSTPYMDEAAWCDELVFLHEGSVLCSGTPQKLLEEFPVPVFHATVAVEEGSLYCQSDIPLSEGVESIYQSGGRLHIVVHDATMTAEMLQTRLQSIIPKAKRVERAAPVIEDVLFHRIVTRQKQPV